MTIKPSPLTVEVASLAGKLVQRLSFDEKGRGVTFRRGSEPVLGLGGGGAQFDRRGSFDAMNNGHCPGEYQIFGSRVPIPFLIGTEGWGLFLHRPFQRASTCGPEGRFEPRAVPRRPAERPLPLDLFVIRADTPPAIMAEYDKITGKPVMPPKWALGYMQSHRTLAGRNEVLEIAETFRRKKLPCDALIYLGTGYTPSGWNTGHGSLDFNPRVFDKPAEIIGKLHWQHLKVILHVNHAPWTLHGEIPAAAGEAAGPDQIATYWARHERPFQQLGVDGWWPDDGDELPIDARLARHRAYYHGSLAARAPAPFSLHRTGYAGMQATVDGFGRVTSYALGYPGRTRADRNQLLTECLAFLGLRHRRFHTYTRANRRTLRALVSAFVVHSFVPIARANLAHPASVGLEHRRAGTQRGRGRHRGLGRARPSELHNAQIEPICRRYLELRYRLMPYLYTAVREAHDTGMPIIGRFGCTTPATRGRPLEATNTSGVEISWWLPSSRKVQRTASSIYPPGSGTTTGREHFMGGQEITRYVNLSTMPLYVRAGQSCRSTRRASTSTSRPTSPPRLPSTRAGRRIRALRR